MKVEHVNVIVEKGPNVKIPLCVPAYEYKLLREMHGQQSGSEIIEGCYLNPAKPDSVEQEMNVYDQESGDLVEEVTPNVLYGSLLRKYPGSHREIRALWRTADDLGREIGYKRPRKSEAA